MQPNKVPKISNVTHPLATSVFLDGKLIMCAARAVYVPKHPKMPPTPCVQLPSGYHEARHVLNKNIHPAHVFYSILNDNVYLIHLN